MAIRYGGKYELEGGSEVISLPADGAIDAMPTYFNWRKASIYSGSSEVQRSIIARAILKF